VSRAGRRSAGVSAAARGGVALATVLATGLVACVAPLDRRVPVDAYVGTRAALEGTPVTRDAGAVEVGFARVRIDTPPGVPLAGYGARGGAPSEGAVDALHARALAVRVGGGAPLVWLTADLLLVEETTRAALDAALADVVAAERLVVGATHTHSGPGGYVAPLVYRPVFGAPDASARRAVLAALEGAARGAIAALGPGRVGHVVVALDDAVENRAIVDGPVDGRAVALVVEGAAGRAALVAFAAHGTIVPAEERRLSGDYPAALTAALEAGGALAVAGFAAAAGGSMAPRLGDAPRGVATARAYGRRLAARLGPAIARARLDDTATLAAARLVLKLPRRQWRTGEGLAVPEFWTALAIPGHAAITGVRLGTGAGALTWLSLPCEPSGELARRLAARVSRRGEALVLAGFGGGYLGYVLPDDRYDVPAEIAGPNHAYESRVMSFFGPHLGGLVSAASWRLSLRLAGE
jgi:neutral ceramidase